jgi:hypothetical protein
VSGGITQLAASTSGWSKAGNIAIVFAALGGTVVAGLVAFMPYARRPRLSLVEDTDKIHSHVEKTPQGRLPYLRVLAKNSKRRRAAQGTRVLVEGYRPLVDPGARMTTLGNPSLGWPSAPEADQTAAVTVFAGGRRPIGLGKLIRVHLDEEGKLVRPIYMVGLSPGGIGIPHIEPDNPTQYGATGWYLWLDLAFAQDISDDRDKLPPVEGGYLIRLLIGADDGAARTFNVHIDWDADPNLDADAVLASALEHLAVVEA